MKLLQLLGIYAVAVLVCGCSSDAASSLDETLSTKVKPDASRPSGGSEFFMESPAGAFPLVVRDRLGRRVAIENPPQRIVSLAPAATELLFAIGAGSQIVAVTRHCDFPPEASRLPNIGGGTVESTSREKLVAFEPDLVVCLWDTHSPLLDQLETFSIPTMAGGADSLDELYQEIEVLGQVTGHATEAQKLVASMRSRVAELTTAVRDIPSEDRHKVFYQVWDDPLMTAGGGSYIGELLELAGTHNVFDDISARYPQVSAEAVVARNPSLILAPSTHDTPVEQEQIMNRPGWSQIDAVREERCVLVDGDLISRCGPRVVDALAEIIQSVYPERYATVSNEYQAPLRSGQENELPSAEDTNP